MSCLHCAEPILLGETSVSVNEGRERLHMECIFRSVAGTATHVARRCAAFGGAEDCHACEQVKSKRDAARASYRTYTEQQAALN